MNHRKFLSAIFIAATLFSSQTAFAEFADVTKSSASYEAIDYLQNNEIVKGYIDGTYRPDSTIKRSEFLKILFASTKTQTELDNCINTMLYRPFKDVNWNLWYGKYLCFAHRNSIVIGYKQDNTFRPDNDISFAEAAKIIVKTYGYDAPEDATWYKPFIVALSNKNAIPATIENLDYKITRSEMAEIMYRLITKNSSKFSLTYDQIAGNDIACMKAGKTAGGYTTIENQTHCCAGLIPYFAHYNRGYLMLDGGAMCLEPQTGLSEAVKILNTPNECTNNSNLGLDLYQTPFKNLNFNGYSFGLKSYQNSCAARCDVDLDKKTAEIGWMCGGVTPDPIPVPMQ